MEEMLEMFRRKVREHTSGWLHKSADDGMAAVVRETFQNGHGRLRVAGIDHESACVSFGKLTSQVSLTTGVTKVRYLNQNGTVLHDPVVGWTRDAVLYPNAPKQTDQDDSSA